MPTAQHAPYTIPQKIVVLSAALFALIFGALLYKSYRESRLIGSPYRYNIVATGARGEVEFLSFDPQEHQVFTITYPDNLEIKSRSVGTYRMGTLATLGTYEGSAGAFVRRKVQGFMRVPIEGFLITTQDDTQVQKRVIAGLVHSAFGQPLERSLSRLDSLVLLMRAIRYEWRVIGSEELVRAGVMSQVDSIYTYNHERLKQYLESRVFDWAVGAHDATVAIVNASEEEGLGRDVAEFMSNIGFDIVSVKSGSEKRDATLVQYMPAEQNNILPLFARLFGWTVTEAADTSATRAHYIVILGKDALDLF